MKRFFDMETHRIITENELRKEYEANEENKEETFADYIVNCTTGNGVLIRIIED